MSAVTTTAPVCPCGSARYREVLKADRYCC